MSRLSQIKDAVQQFAEATSAALGLDVEVVDDNLQRIAGTGHAYDLIGKFIQSRGIINRFLFKDTKKIIIDKPGACEYCQICPKYGKCIYKMAVYSSIEYRSKAIGVIGLTAMNDHQIKLIEHNKYAMLDFVDKIANLISLKVKEHEMLKQVETYAQFMHIVIDNINKGIVILNKDHIIVDINSYLIEKLSTKKVEIINKNIRDIFPNINLVKKKTNTTTADNEYQEIVYSNKGKQIYLLCMTKTIIVDNQIEGIICLIEDYKDTKQLDYDISEKQRQISLADIVGNDTNFIAFKEKVLDVARNDSTVLLTGETGTGKELFARAIHTESMRKDKPFVIINCGAIPESLIESELFGYEKGAFTGAKNIGKHGKFYIADKGTVFLDEIETMPLYLQTRLLRVIENQEIERVGGIKSIPIDVRIVAATNVRLDEMVRNGQFREDLYHRLNVVTLFIPPLRDRGEDILVLAQHFIEKFSKRFKKDIFGLSEEVKKIFLNYQWKGNVRELQNTIEYAINMEHGNYITAKNLPFQFRQTKSNNKFVTLEEREKEYIKKALDEFGWSEEGRLEAAKHLGISRATIYRKIKKYGLVCGSNSNFL
ncbi:sigma-54 interaction domain-containing protein [Lutispora sp.]|uniref:sigma-54 interaction domain-containing protein n=1 Tax=Lutispora sp. TaxID=2828727 RepID=UPI0035672A92